MQERARNHIRKQNILFTEYAVYATSDPHFDFSVSPIRSNDEIPADQEKNPLKHDSFLLHKITAIRGSEINY